MCDVARRRSTTAERIAKNKKLSSKVVFDLEKFISSKKSEVVKFQYFFSKDSKYLLLSILSALNQISREEIWSYFPQISPQEQTVQFQVSERFDMGDTIGKIEKFLMITNTKYKFIMPLPDFQEEYIKFRKH